MVKFSDIFDLQLLLQGIIPILLDNRIGLYFIFVLRFFGWIKGIDLQGVLVCAMFFPGVRTVSLLELFDFGDNLVGKIFDKAV